MEEEIRDIIKNNSWRETYKQICIASALPKDISATSVACEEENRIRNRYGDVHPYDHSRVCLPDASNDYINASLVVNELASRRYILAQGPLPNTIGHFWSMVWHENSGAILMLNKLMEKGVNKCEQYWPPNPGETLLCEDVHIKVENLQSESRNDYILTTLRITDLNSNKERGVLHFQYIAWPDFGVPRCPDTFLNFLDAVRQTGSLDADAGPPIVHCSAGIGRSGTFCLVDTSLVLIAKEGPGSVVLKDVLLDLRSYRMGLIQTWEQLKFSYLAIVSGAKRDGQLSESFLDDVIQQPPRLKDSAVLKRQWSSHEEKNSSPKSQRVVEPGKKTSEKDSPNTHSEDSKEEPK
eukprot:TRINITY_DN1293_c0_g1_i4.p1 TRINITY_DN1293_c0_g1~~TRINITY_DN1293_c0_g1_i4.p1  ORF type:complete len:351 (-),score=73.82 TRINITY_DN1293_c0_g1_i4:214-1266(-)